MLFIAGNISGTLRKIFGYADGNFSGTQDNYMVFYHNHFYLITQDDKYELYVWYPHNRHLLSATHRITKGTKLSEVIKIFDLKYKPRFHQALIRTIFLAKKIAYL